MNEKFKKQFPTRKELEIVSSTRQWKQMDLAARIIQRALKAFCRWVNTDDVSQGGAASCRAFGVHRVLTIDSDWKIRLPYCLSR